MRAKEVVGKTVKRIHQTRFVDRGQNQIVHTLDWVEFTDGTRLFLMAHDDGTDNYVTGWTAKP